jgi:hypothetical protein
MLKQSVCIREVLLPVISIQVVLVLLCLHPSGHFTLLMYPSALTFNGIKNLAVAVENLPLYIEQKVKN